MSEVKPLVIEDEYGRKNTFCNDNFGLRIITEDEKGVTHITVTFKEKVITVILWLIKSLSPADVAGDGKE